jgi:hypothetical protein
MRPAVRRPLAAAFLTPPVALLLLVPLGYGLRPLAEFTRGHEPLLGFVWFALPLAAFGAGVAVALRHGVRVTPVISVLALLYAASAGWMAGGPAYRTVLDFNAAGAVVSTLGLLACCAEYVARNWSAVRRSLSPGALRWALRVGVVHAVALVAVRIGVLSSMYGGATLDVLLGGLNPVVLAWTAFGAFVLGAVPAYLFFRSRLVTPASLVVVLSTLLSVTTVRDELGRASSGAVWAAAFTPLTGYLVGWFAVLALVLVVGSLEYALRRQSGIAPPRSLRVRAGE